MNIAFDELFVLAYPKNDIALASTMDDRNERN
jgi:hypothetical protein